MKKKKIYFFLLLLFFPVFLLIIAEISARVKTFLQSKNSRFLFYHGGIVFAPIREEEPLLRSLAFQLDKKSTIKEKNIIFFGSSVMGSALDYIQEQFRKRSFIVEKNYSYNNVSHTMYYNPNAVIVFEALSIPYVYNYFHLHNPTKKLIGENLYQTLYFNSVFFLRLTEKFLEPNISFGEKSVQSFFEITLPKFEKTFKNIHAQNMPLLLVIFPDNHRLSVEKHYGRIIRSLNDSIAELADKYQIKTCNIYKDHSQEFSPEDFRDSYHFNEKGTQKVSRFIVQAVQSFL